MVQRQFPMFPVGSTLVTHDLAVEKRDGKITYFYATPPVFTHDENDDASFQMITAQFYANSYVKQMDIVRAFGVTPISVKRAVKRYQERYMSTNLSHFCDIKLATQVHGGFAPKPPRYLSKGNDIIFLQYRLRSR